MDTNSHAANLITTLVTPSSNVLPLHDDTFFNLTHKAFALGDPTTETFLAVNPACARLYGYTPEEMVGMSVLRIVAPHLRDGFDEMVRRCDARQKVCFTTEHVRKDGTVFPALVDAVNVRDAGGRVLFRLGCFEDITEQRRTEAALRESDENYRWAVELSPHIPWVADAKGNVTEFNQRWLALTGLTHEQAIGGGWMQVPHPDDLSTMTAAWTHAVRTGEDYDVEHRIRMADGSYRWMRSFATPRRDAEGQIEKWYGITEDVHERRLMQDALVASRERFRLAAEAMNGLIYDYDVVAGTVYRSPGLLELTGYNPDEVEASFDWWYNQIHPVDRAVNLEDSRALFEGKMETFAGEYRVRHRDGRWIWVRDHGRLVRDAGGGVTRIVGCTTDVTARHEAEIALRASEARFRELANALPQFVYRTNPEGVLDFVNSYWTEYTGLSVSDTLRDGPVSVIHPEDWPMILENYVNCLAAGVPYEYEFRCRRASDSAYRWFLSRAVPVRDKDGKLMAWVGASTDIDDLKSARAEIEDLNLRLRRAMQETHHRVKNNLQVIAALADMQDDGSDVVPASVLRRIGSHVRNLANIHDLLTRQSQVNGELSHLRVGDVMGTLLPLLRATLGERALRFSYDDFAVTVKQASALVLLVNELVSNAVKHGDGAIRVSVVAPEEAQQTSAGRLEVWNDGLGFPPGFDARRAANTGLDLVLTITRHDLLGDAAFLNPPEGGALVAVTFPRHD